MQFRPRLIRSLLAALTGGSLAILAFGLWRTWHEVGVQGWVRDGFGWLGLDHWSRQLSWKAGGVGALATFVVVAATQLVGERTRFARCARRAGALVGHPLSVVSAGCAAFLLPTLVARATQPAARPESPNVLFVLVDTWRADHAGFLGYERDVSPNLDRLVTSGLVFENTQSSSSWTKPSVATLFTGLMPSKHRAISQPVLGLSVRGTILPPGVTTFVEILRSKGWDTAMWSNNPNILPERGFAQGAGHFVDYFYHPDRTKTFDPGRAERMLPDVRAWLADERDEERPFCAYVHIMDPHYPYVAPEPFRGTFDSSGADFQLLGPVIDEYRSGERNLADITSADLQRIVDIYDEELLYVDHWLGPFLAEVLAEHPNTIVILSGDHGEEFLEHGQLGHGHSLYQELTHVPLVIWAPGLEPGRVAQQVRLMDVFPTLLELAGFADETPAEAQGSSLLPLARGEETDHRLAPMETGGDERPPWHWRALSDGRFKVIRRENDLPTKRPVPSLAPWDQSEPRPTWRMFDLEADPGETIDLYLERSEQARDLFAELARAGWYAPPEMILRLRARAGDAKQDNQELLRALGYAGDEVLGLEGGE